MLIGYRALGLNSLGFRLQGVYSPHLAIHRIFVESGTLHNIMTAFLLVYCGAWPYQRASSVS